MTTAEGCYNMTQTTEIDRPPIAAAPAIAPLLSVRNIEVVYDDVILVLRTLSSGAMAGAAAIGGRSISVV